MNNKKYTLSQNLLTFVPTFFGLILGIAWLINRNFVSAFFVIIISFIFLINCRIRDRNDIFMYNDTNQDLNEGDKK